MHKLKGKTDTNLLSSLISPDTVLGNFTQLLTLRIPCSKFPCYINIDVNLIDLLRNDTKHQLNSWYEVQHLTIVHLINKDPSYYGTRRFIAVFTKA